MYSKKNYNLNELPDFVSILKNDLNLSKVALGWISLPPGKGYSFLQSHKEQWPAPPQSLFRCNQSDVMGQKGLKS
jgi:hypothetical protein